ncbi:glycosyltransferase involved in cell wall biosynthesis [Arcticibacter tournemirensis]|uniref:Glycosyltransferase family 1 protein n=1 Tax=Arcticibacter tournemirensis TaxID=699437 RepID=A0A5M9H5V5_9SPHI|nr:DUF1972 domain-containing protein [Arcticibacter tournemirensis]KAA8482030.1 glycosyltransferase family 1 protein [Arcticibacter tournemirensis]TQM49435.1 glycosyltransferase involved in cell wall biosynthesis [Arcticibacter tournemirensis]
MKIAIVGTRGIPNHYGGFEQFADFLSQGLVQKGHDITVYSSKNHPYKESDYNGVKILHKYDPEDKIGTAGQFIYDLLCMADARKRGFDIIYLLGYTSSSVWQRILIKKSIVVTNMDGLEWMRSKYSKQVQRFLKYAEKLATKYSDHLVADSIGIQSYLKKTYNAESFYIPYGSHVFSEPNKEDLIAYGVTAYNYDILIARFEPENNIEMILEAFSKSSTSRKLLLIGNFKHTDFGIRMARLYGEDTRICFLGPIYNQVALNNLRYFSNLYYHGHSVGGTNPSLLEAMGSSSLICYHNNDFNRTIVGNDGFPFDNYNGLKEIIEGKRKEDFFHFLTENIEKIKNIYSWQRIVDRYEDYFLSIIPKS